MRNAVAVIITLLVLSTLLSSIQSIQIVKANPFMFGPEWKINLPEQSNSKTYQTSTVPIEIQIYTPTDYSKIIRIYYILDLNYSSNNNPQKTLTISNPQSITYYAKPSILYSATGNSDYLSNGNHTMDVYAVNAKGETLKSYTRNFQVNATSISSSDNNRQLLTETNIAIALVAIIAITIGIILVVLVLRHRKTTNLK